MIVRESSYLALSSLCVLLTGACGDTTKPSEQFPVVVALQALRAEPFQSPINGQSHASQFSAQGGQPPYSWSLTGGALPAGLSLSSGGLLTGAATGSGAYSYRLTVTDAKGATGAIDFSGTISTSGSIPFQLPSITLPPYGINQNLGFMPAIQGGTPPYTFVITGLPPGITFDATTGTISGKATSQGTSTISVSLKDATGKTAAGSPVNVTVAILPPQSSPPGTFTGYNGTYLGQFNMQWQYYDYNTNPLGTLVTGSSAFSVTLTLESDGLAAGNGLVHLKVTKATAASPWFNCQTGCSLGSSGFTLQSPPVNQSTLAYVGFVITFPLNRQLYSPERVHMSSDGRIISNGLDPNIQRYWEAGDGTGIDGFYKFTVPAAYGPNACCFYVTRATWAFTRSSL